MFNFSNYPLPPPVGSFATIITHQIIWQTNPRVSPGCAASQKERSWEANNNNCFSTGKISTGSQASYLLINRASHPGVRSFMGFYLHHWITAFTSSQISFDWENEPFQDNICGYNHTISRTSHILVSLSFLLIWALCAAQAAKLHLPKGPKNGQTTLSKTRINFYCSLQAFRAWEHL